MWVSVIYIGEVASKHFIILTGKAVIDFYRLSSIITLFIDLIVCDL